jgi:5-methylthioadenosine/S-adenosylhomocysteine deaminase
MATRSGAIAMGLAEEIGSLEVGKQADIVVFDFRRAHLTPCLNALGNLVHTCQGRDVEMVFVAGRLAVESGQALLCDEQKIRAEAAAVSRELWEKARRDGA